MSKIKILIAALSVLGMLTACGEGFKATSIQNGVVGPDPDPVPPIINENKSRHQEIYDSYLGEFSGARASSVRSIKSAIDIGAFEIRVIDTGRRGAANILRVDATIQLSCDQPILISSDNSNLRSSLNSGNRVSLGSNGGYDIRLQCVDTNCDEMVAAIRRPDTMNPGIVTHDGLVLVGLGKNEESVSGESVVKSYGPRNVISQINANRDHYATGASVSSYNVACAQSAAERAQMVTNPGSSQTTVSGFEQGDPRNQNFDASIPVDPTGGSQQGTGDPTVTGFESEDPHSQAVEFDPLWFDPNTI